MQISFNEGLNIEYNLIFITYIKIMTWKIVRS